MILLNPPRVYRILASSGFKRLIRGGMQGERLFRSDRVPLRLRAKQKTATSVVARRSQRWKLADFPS